MPQRDPDVALRSFLAAEEPLRKMAATKISEESAGVSTLFLALRLVKELAQLVQCVDVVHSRVLVEAWP
jgi:hypothetical protein